MAEAKAPKGAAKGLNAKVGGVPVKFIVAALAGVTVLWYLHRRNANQQITSAGTSATPTDATDTSAQTGDGTGQPDYSGLLAQLNAELAQIITELPYYGSYHSGSQPSQASKASSGGNTSTAPKASSPTQPATSHAPVGSPTEITGVHQVGGQIVIPTQTTDGSNVHRPGAFI